MVALAFLPHVPAAGWVWVGAVALVLAGCRVAVK